MDDKTRIRCEICGSEFDEEYIEYYLETDDPESDYIGHCPVCWEKDMAAISIIDPEAIRLECADKAKRAILSAPSDIVTRAYAASLAEEAIVFAELAHDDGKPECEYESFMLDDGSRVQRMTRDMRWYRIKNNRIIDHGQYRADIVERAELKRRIEEAEG